jgi:2-polyprenyl-3-methyl-5-hydroxy-6-metoxy-1,4-benzoquinol methylase
MHGDLTDPLFGAPGRWTLWQCQECATAWLDPRPDPASIGRAYSAYLTHSVSEAAIRLARPGIFQGIKLQATHAILNHELGYHLNPSLPLPLARWILSRKRQRQILNRVRHLPAPRDPTKRVLDIGSGNGAFLFIARNLGYEATGLEPDPHAASLARAHGLTVHAGTLPHPALPREHYDHLTLAHVVEHLHDPLATLRECNALLRPGGRLWLQTPNLKSAGHAYWGRDWRGLEPPRHLVLFTPESLQQLLRKAGFQGIDLLPSPLEAQDMFRHSLAIRLGVDLRTNRKPRLDRTARRAARWADGTASGDPQAAEAITAVAWK